jgi:hypothetical protein
MDKVIVELELLRAGQPRPYADSMWEATLTFSDPYDGTWTPDHKTVIRFIKAFYYDDFYAGEGKREQHTPYLDSLIQTANNQWKVVIVSPYMD